MNEAPRSHMRPRTNADTRRAQGYTPTARAGRRPQPTRGGGVPRNMVPACIAAVILVVFIGAGIYFWNNQPINVTLNGKAAQVPKNAKPADLIKASGNTYNAGNLVSVTGNVITAGDGYPYSIKLNGEDIANQDVTSFVAHQGDNIELGNGVDKLEDYSVTSTKTEPKLALDGTWGSLAYVSQWGKEGTTEKRTGSISGETAEVVTEEVQDCVVSIRNPKPDDDKKIVALTFDDGPSDYTQRYLDILNSHNIKATFFCLGPHVESYKDHAMAIVNQGSQIASHTYNHEQLAKLDAEDLQKEHKSAFAAIADVTGVNTTVFRPPYGDYRQGTWAKSGGLATVSVLWTQDSEDWRRPGVDAIVKNSLKGIGPGSIILMHDGGGNRDQDLEALPQIIETLQQQGYSFVTIDELMQSDSTIPKDIATGNATMPADAVWPTEVK